MVLRSRERGRVGHRRLLQSERPRPHPARAFVFPHIPPPRRVENVRILPSIAPCDRLLPLLLLASLPAFYSSANGGAVKPPSVFPPPASKPYSTPSTPTTPTQAPTFDASPRTRSYSPTRRSSMSTSEESSNASPSFMTSARFTRRCSTSFTRTPISR